MLIIKLYYPYLYYIYVIEINRNNKYMTCGAFLQKLCELEDKEQYIILATANGINEYNFIYVNEIKLVWDNLMGKYCLWLLHNTNINDKFLTVNDIITHIEKLNNKYNISKIYIETYIRDVEKNKYIRLILFDKIIQRKDNIMLSY